METVGYLGDAQLGGTQQVRSLHEEHLIDIIYNRAACDLTYHTRQIDGRDMEPVGIEGNIVMLSKVVGQQTDEADKYFFYALGRLAVHNGTLLGVLQIEQEDGIEHTQYLTFIYMVGLQIADNLPHLHDQMLRGISR